MKPSQIPFLLLPVCLCMALAACGGGSDDNSTPEPDPGIAAASFNDCFELTPGVAYTMKDTDEGGDDAGQHGVLVVKEAFEGTERTGTVDLRDDTKTRLDATYWSVESNGIRLWGGVDYDYSAGTATSKQVQSDGAVLPLAMQAGASTTVNYTTTTTQLSGSSAGQTSTATEQQTWTFEGFETLTLGGTTFTDTCRIKTATTGETSTVTRWYAKGFGLIRGELVLSTGTVDATTTLQAVTAQP